MIGTENLRYWVSKGGKTGEGTGPVEERGLVVAKGEHLKGKKKKVKRNERQNKSSRWIEVTVLHS